MLIKLYTMIKISNKNSSQYVEDKTPFKGSNLTADWENGSFVVRSYKHYPIFVFKSGKWYENKNRYSVTTAKQMTQCGWRIRQNATLKTTEELREIIRDGKEDDSLRFMKAFLKIGELTQGKNETLEDKIKYKEKIVFATMRNSIPDWEPPQDWNTISNADKLERLTKLEQV